MKFWLSHPFLGVVVGGDRQLTQRQLRGPNITVVTAAPANQEKSSVSEQPPTRLPPVPTTTAVPPSRPPPTVPLPATPGNSLPPPISSNSHRTPLKPTQEESDAHTSSSSDETPVPTSPSSVKDLVRGLSSKGINPGAINRGGGLPPGARPMFGGVPPSTASSPPPQHHHNQNQPSPSPNQTGPQGGRGIVLPPPPFSGRGGPPSNNNTPAASENTGRSMPRKTGKLTLPRTPCTSGYTSAIRFFRSGARKWT